MLVKRIRVPLKVRFHFQDDVILVQLGKDGGDLPLSESIVERIVNHLGCDPQTRGCVPINDE